MSRLPSTARIALLVAALTAAAVIVAVEAASPGSQQDSPARGLGAQHSSHVNVPHYKHVVLAIFENHQQSQVIGSPQAPYLTGLSKRGASFTQSYGIEHPSQPNYLDLFAGSNKRVTDDSCPNALSGANLASQLRAKGRRFVGYSEGLPAAGSAVCTSGRYARKHAPWANFANLKQAKVGQPLTAFPKNFKRLPNVSWVVPDLCHDMHDCPVGTGDIWARKHLRPYAKWAKSHNSLLIVTFDEDDYLASNRIATIFFGDQVKPGEYKQRIDHFTVLRTIEEINGLKPLGNAANRRPISKPFGH